MIPSVDSVMGPGPTSLLDHHSHLDDPGADVSCLNRQLHELREAGWPGALLPGYGPARHERARQLVAEFPCLFRAIGLHPEALALCADDQQRQEAWLSLCEELQAPQVVAIGEIGLDQRYRKQMSLSQQNAWFIKGLELAQQQGLPVVLHIVGWHGHALAALAPFAPLQGVVHRYSGPPELVDAYEALGLHLSLSPEAGVAERKRESVARAIAADRLLLETDWPQGDQSYPEALRAMQGMLAQVSEWQQENPNKLAQRLAENARRVYRTAWR